MAASWSPQHPRMLSWLVVLVSLFGARVCANGENGVFMLYPQGGETFYSTDTVNVSYTSPFTSPILFLWCGTKAGGVIGGGPRETKRINAPPGNSWLLVPMNFTTIDICWFNLRPTPEPGNGANGPSFNHITDPNRPATTLGLDSITSSGTTTGSSPSATSSAGAGSAGAGSAGAGSGGGGGGGLSTSAIIGLAVGLALLVAIIVGGIGVACWLRRQKREKAARVALSDQAYTNDKDLPPNTTYDSTLSQTSRNHSPAGPEGLTPHQMSPVLLSDSHASNVAAHGNWGPPNYHGHAAAGYHDSAVLCNKQPSWSSTAGTPPPAEIFTPSDALSAAHTTAPSHGTPSSVAGSPAELPSRHGNFGYGNEHEIAGRQAVPGRQADQPNAKKDSEGKFLLKDLFVSKLLKQPATELDAVPQKRHEVNG